MTPDRTLRVPGIRLRHPPEVEVEDDVLETRRYHVRTVRLRSPWLESESTPGVGARYEVRILAFEDPSGEPVGDLLEEGYVRPRPGHYELVSGELAGRQAVVRRPVDATRTPRAAYVRGERRFFFVEWKGPAREILDTLELDPDDATSTRTTRKEHDR